MDNWKISGFPASFGQILKQGDLERSFLLFFVKKRV